MKENNALIGALNQLVLSNGNKSQAAKALGVARTTFNDMIERAERLGLSPSVLPPSIEVKLAAQEIKHKAEIKDLRQQLDAALKDGLETDFVRSKIFGLAEHEPRQPSWTFNAPAQGTGFAGVPSLMISDVHWGEVVKPEEVGYHNEFNREIAVERMKRTFEGAIDLTTNHVTAKNIPGIVLALGGDMVSGDIHYELAKTNDGEVLEHVFDLFDNLVEGINALADQFGNVFVPCAYGNHGRNTVKPMYKSAAATNFDWLLYNMLERHYKAANKNVRFSVPRGFDTLYNIYNTNFCLTHGDRLGAAGGKGQIGAIAPIARGMKNIKAQYNTLGQHIDYVLMGHWHTLMEIPNEGFVNGCFPAGTNVVTEEGVKNIIDIAAGDKVLSRDGTVQTVTHCFEKQSSSLVGIKVAGLPNVLQATPNHLIWASKGTSSSATVTPKRREFIDKNYGKAQWVPMDFVSVGDYVHVPYQRGSELPIDEETAWAYGLFIAEGHSLLDGGSSKKHHRIGLTMHQREKETVERWARWFEKTFHKSPTITIRDSKNTCDLSVSAGRDVSVWFRDMFGHTSKNKKLPKDALSWHPKLKKALLDGWYNGDGHSAVQADCRNTVSATTISEQLAWNMFQCALDCGYFPSLSSLKAGGPRKNTAYTVHLNTGQNVITIDGEVFYRVTERYETDASVPVFDLEVSGEHTYCVEGIGVHNSLKGYDEFAAGHRFAPEKPAQLLFWTHPKHGITFRSPVYVEGGKGDQSAERPWVSWKA